MMEFYESFWYAIVRGVTEALPLPRGLHEQALSSIMGRQYEVAFMDFMALGVALGIAFYYRKDIFKKKYKKPALFVRGIIASLLVFVSWELVGNVLLARLGGISLFLGAILALVYGAALCSWPSFTKKTAKKGQTPDTTQWGMFVLAQAMAPVTGFSALGLSLVLAQKYEYSAKKSIKNCLCLLILPLILTGLKILVIPDRFDYLAANASQLFIALGITAVSSYFAIRFLVKYFKNHDSLKNFGRYCVMFAALILIFELSK